MIAAIRQKLHLSTCSNLRVQLFSRGAKFLTDAEHTVYCRRLPVRYAAKSAGPKPEVCGVCGSPATPGNPLQAARRIPFNTGIIQYRLTPDWLDRSENLVWAHRAGL
jgi:hypothetical protein